MQLPLQLPWSLIKTSVYVDALKSYYEACHKKGEKCRNFNSDEKKSMMQAISKKIDELGLSEDSSRVHTIETVEMILQDKVTDSIKAELTVSPDPAITPVVEFKNLDMAFDNEMEVDEVAEEKEQESFISERSESSQESMDLDESMVPDMSVLELMKQPFTDACREKRIRRYYGRGTLNYEEKYFIDVSSGYGVRNRRLPG